MRLLRQPKTSRENIERTQCAERRSMEPRSVQILGVGRYASSTQSTISRASPVVETTRKSDLAEALRQAIELITGHHEIGFIRRAFEQTTGSCELCKESRLFRIGQVLEKYDAAVLADTRVVKGVQEAPQPMRKVAEEFVIKFDEPDLGISRSSRGSGSAPSA